MPEEILILAVDPDWSEPVEERHEYLTDILAAYNSLEQRVQLRSLPRFGLKFRLVLPAAEEAARFESDLWRLGARRVQVPLWPDATALTADAAASETFLELITANRRFWAGYSAMLWRDPETYEIVEIESIAAGGLTLATPLADDWAGDGRTYVIPILLGRLEDAPQMARLTSRVGAIEIATLSEGMPEDEGIAAILQAAATALVTMTRSGPLRSWVWATRWTGFTDPGLPEDAVVQAIYAVADSSRYGTQMSAGASVAAWKALSNPWSVGPTAVLIKSEAPDVPWDGVFHVNMSEWPHLMTVSDLPNASAWARLFQTLNIPSMDDNLAVSAIGFAIYYTSATPRDDSTDLPPPVEIPEGQGLAWSYPTAVEAHAWFTGFSDGSAAGTAFVAPDPGTEPTSYRGFDVLDLQPDESQDTIVTYRRSLHHLDPQTGVNAAWDRATPAPYGSAAGMPLIGRQPVRLLLEGRAEIARALILLARRRGALVPFWLPTWASDLQMSANLAEGVMELHVKAVGYAAGPFQSPARRFLAFILRDGTQYYREIFDAQPGDPGEEVLTLDSGLPLTLSKDQTLVSYLILCRLAFDDPRLTWHSNQVVECILEVAELPSEVAVEVGS